MRVYTRFRELALKKIMSSRCIELRDYTYLRTGLLYYRNLPDASPPYLKKAFAVTIIIMYKPNRAEQRSAIFRSLVYMTNTAVRCSMVRVSTVLERNRERGQGKIHEKRSLRYIGVSSKGNN